MKVRCRPYKEPINSGCRHPERVINSYGMVTSSNLARFKDTLYWEDKTLFQYIVTQRSYIFEGRLSTFKFLHVWCHQPCNTIIISECQQVWWYFKSSVLDPSSDNVSLTKMLWNQEWWGPVRSSKVKQGQASSRRLTVTLKREIACRQACRSKNKLITSRNNEIFPLDFREITSSNYSNTSSWRDLLFELCRSCAYRKRETRFLFLFISNLLFTWHLDTIMHFVIKKMLCLYNTDKLLLKYTIETKY